MRRAAPFFFGVEVLGWALWFGGLVTVALVAPLVFQVVPSRDLAGRVFGAVLGRLFPLVYLCGGVQLLVGLGRGSADRLTRVKHALVALVLAIAAYTGVVVMDEMVSIQSAFPAPIENIPLDDPRRVRFDALHSLSERLMGVDAVLGLLLLPLMVATRPRVATATDPDAQARRARRPAAVAPSP